MVCFNLVGNPYQSYLNFDLLYEESANEGLIDNSFAIRDDDGKQYLFYTYEASSNEGYTATNLIHPHQGFFVRVNDDKGVGSYNLTFTNAMRVSGNLAENHPFRGSHLNYPLVNLLCFDSQGHRDLTTVEVGRPELGGGHKMFKFVNGDARLYARLEGGSYQTLFTPTGVNEVPVCFEAQNDGSFKLQWNTLHGDFYYLHLIDNLTGADIDMLDTDEYRFEGRTSDYASRFKLVFRCTGVEEQYDNNNTGSETFAFISDGNIIVLTDARSASLQVIDMLGRILLTHQVTSDFRLPTSDFSPGVYVLRLINGSDIKTQKLIINQ